MSWIETTTKQFTMPIDFGGIISYGVNEHEVILDGLRTKVVGKNYMGYYIVKVVSIENIGAPYIHSANEIIVTPLITFTVDCIKLTPQRVIADVIMSTKNIGKKGLSSALATSVSSGTSGSSVTSGGREAEISVIYTDKGAEFPVNTTWPTIISSVTHAAYSSKIIVTGSVLVPITPSFYSHDGSKAASQQFIIAPSSPMNEESTVIFNKLRVLYEIPNMPGAILSGTQAYDDDVIYTSAGPMGPIHQLKVGDEFGGMSWSDIKAAAKKVNMYDVHGMTVDAKNAIIFVANEYASGAEGKARVSPYLSYVRNEILRIKRLMTTV